MKPKISVIIPCYNYGKYIEDAVESVLKQTFSDFEVIIVDDGSTDKFTKKVLNDLTKKYPSVVFLRQMNGHISNARNNGIKVSKGEYILPMDADDTIEPEMLEACCMELDKDPKIGYVYTHVRFFGSKNFIWKNLEYNFYDLLFNNQPSVCSLMRREAWNEVGGYDEKMKTGYEDWEFWINLGEKGWHGKLLKKALFNYRKHGTSFIDDAKQKNEENIVYIREKHKNLYSDASLMELKRIWKSGNILVKFQRMFKKEASTIKQKLYLAELFNLEIWKNHPMKALSRCVPVRIKKIGNRLIGKDVFKTDYFSRDI